MSRVWSIARETDLWGCHEEEGRWIRKEEKPCAAHHVPGPRPQIQSGPDPDPEMIDCGRKPRADEPCL